MSRDVSSLLPHPHSVPKVIVPRQSGLTARPDRPSVTYCVIFMNTSNKMANGVGMGHSSEADGSARAIPFGEQRPFSAGVASTAPIITQRDAHELTPHI